MKQLVQDPASYRDPSGHVYRSGDRIFRTVNKFGVNAFEKVRTSGILDRLTDQGLLLPGLDVTASDVPRPPGAVYLLEHPRIPFISYPYEWSFSLYKAAALHHLDLHLAALDGGFTLSDASAYNIQFLGTRPIFIDHLSLVPYKEGMMWEGHRQFCCQFLNPLILWSRLGVAPGPWIRGSGEGVLPGDLARLLAIRHHLSWTVLTHVVGQSFLDTWGATRSSPQSSPRRPMSRNAILGIISGLRRYIERLPSSITPSTWTDYASNTSYNEEDYLSKRGLVEDMVRKVRPQLLFDVGCNSGNYSDVALGAGAESVVGFDSDFGSLELAIQRFRGSDQQVLPLWMDLANPSPSQGWAEHERMGLRERGPGDALIALAIVHHLAIGRNIPLAGIVEWLMSLAPQGVVEFPQKTDPMVQRLLMNRVDVFSDYTEEHFLKCLTLRAKITGMVRLKSNERLLVWYSAAEGRQ